MDAGENFYDEIWFRLTSETENEAVIKGAPSEPFRTHHWHVSGC